MSAFLPDGEHFNDVYCEECQCFVKELCWLHATTVHDAPTVPLAVASIPDVLYFADSIERGNSVFAKRALRPHMIFGPLIAHGHTSTVPVKMDNDICCNWMKFVSVVGQWEEPNLRLLLRDEQVVFVSVKVVLPGEELKLAVEPRYMPMMDTHSAKPTRFADVHLQISQDSLRPTESEMPNISAWDAKGIVIDHIVDGDTPCIGAPDAVPTNSTDAIDLIRQIPWLTTVKDEALLEHGDSPGYPSAPLFMPSSVANEEDAKMDSCAQTDSDKHDDSACDVTSIRIDDVVDKAVSNSASEGVPPSTFERDPIPVQREPTSDREGSPEYPFPPFCGAPNVTKEPEDKKESNSDERCDSPIARYPFRSRVTRNAETTRRNPHEADALPLDPVMEEADGMIDDSDVDADYRLSASDVESSTDSDGGSQTEFLPPAKRHKPCLANHKNQVPYKATKAPLPPAATSLDAVLTASDGTISNVSNDRCASNEQHTPQGSDFRRFVCPECALHFFSDQLLQWHRQFQHQAVISVPWTVGMACPACRASNAYHHTMVAHVEQHGFKPDGIKHSHSANACSEVYRFVCPECSRHFHSEQLFHWHRQFQHGALVPTPWKAGMACPVCKRTRRGALYHTMSTHVERHGIEPDRIKHFRSTSDPSIMRHLSSPSAVVPDAPSMDHEVHTLCFLRSSSVCHSHACTLRFCTEDLAAVHAMQHVPRKTYEGGLACPGCGFTAEDVGQLVEHVSQHGAERDDRKMCRLCGQFRLDMQEHTRSVHKVEYDQFVEESYTEKCEQCGKLFQTKAQLKVHNTNSHTTKRAQCFICAKQFPNANTLKQHYEEHRTENGLTCPTCQEVFPLYRTFALHVKKHDVRLMRVCEVCQNVFSNAVQLAQHMLGHEADYKYRCEPCGKSFKRSGNLSQHNQCVHGERFKQRRKERKEEMAKEGYVCPRRRMDYEDFPHKCEECRLGWLRRGGLEQHRMRKHGPVDRAEL